VLKKRIIATLVVKDGIVVQSIGFKKYLPVGKPNIAVEYLNQWGIDEIILLDISASSAGRKPLYDMVKRAALKCFVPLTLGGGITKIDHIKELMHCGSDKISINQTALKNPKFITEAANVFGSQCIVVSIDSIKDGAKYKVYDHLQKRTLKITPAELAKISENAGAGEILINSVDRDGSYLGYDIDLINSVCEQTSIPVIVCGGAKNATDFLEVFNKTNTSAAAAGNFFHFTEHSVNITKANIIKQADVRFETFTNYLDNKFDKTFRLLKKNDTTLEEMLFVRIEKEVI